MTQLLDNVLASAPDAVIFDIDGTVSDPTHRLPLIKHLPIPDRDETARAWDAFHAAGVKDPPHDHMLQLLTLFSLFRYRIVFCTGRPDNHREATKTWLAYHVKSPHDALFMRKHGDWRPDHEVKADMLRLIRDGLKLNPVMAFDDREAVARMFQDQGIPCLVYDHTLRSPVEPLDSEQQLTLGEVLSADEPDLGGTDVKS